MMNRQEKAFTKQKLHLRYYAFEEIKGVTSE